MSLVSNLFLLFVVASVLVYYIVPQKWQWLVLLVFSYIYSVSYTHLDVYKRQIVTFRNAKGKVSHRVVAKQKQSYITKGDANNTEDVSLLEPDVYKRQG